MDEQVKRDKKDIQFFSCDEDAEHLIHCEPYEAIMDYLDGITEGEEPEEIELFEYAPIVLRRRDFLVLECLLENLDENYGWDGGIPFEPTDKMKKAEQTFIDVIMSEYDPGSCEVVSSKTINVKKWLEENK